jgi:hypothetical protein
MEGMRLVEGKGLSAQEPCVRCQANGCPWDRIAGKPICPDCQEALALGEAPALSERAERRRCLICQHLGTVSYLTYPLQSAVAIELDLCLWHFQALLSRRLERHALLQVSRQLHTLGLSAKQVFLLHDAFYDENGRALQPVPEMY